MLLVLASESVKPRSYRNERFLRIVKSDKVIVENRNARWCDGVVNVWLLLNTAYSAWCVLKNWAG